MKKTVDDYLNEIDYRELNNYRPSAFSISYMNFVKMVNAGKDDIQSSPVLHYKMIDGLVGKKTHIANLCSRGLAKALSLDTQILTKDGIKEMREINVGDWLFDRNGKLTQVIATSEIFTNQCYKFELEDGTSFIANEDHIHILQRMSKDRKVGTYWKEVELTTKELLSQGSIHYSRKISDRHPTGKESKWFIPLISKPLEYPTKDLLIDPYTLGVVLGDGNISCNTYIVRLTGHKDDLFEILSNISYKAGTIFVDKRNPNTLSCNLLGSGKDFKSEIGYVTGKDKYIPQQYLMGSIEQRLSLLQGLMDTDGTICDSGHCSFSTISETLALNVRYLVKSLGGYAKITYIQNDFSGYYRLQIHLWDFNPFKLKRKADKWIPNKKYKRGKRVAIKSITPIDELVESKCLMVDSPTKSFILNGNIVTHNTTMYGEMLVLYLAVFNVIPDFGKVDVIMYVADSMENGAKSFRKNVESRYNDSAFLKKYLPEVKFTDNDILFTNLDGKQTYVKMFGAKSGVRGFKMFGNRPVLAILDDLVSDEDANSPTQLNKIKDTVYNGVNQALNPMRKKIVFNGTPFNKNDPLYEAIESGKWHSNVFPVCNEFPCKREDFVGAWESRFTYDFLMNEYELAVATGRVKSFKQELMLRIASTEDRMILDDDIRWFNSHELMANKQRYNFVITTDFATSTQRKADYTVIGVWALDSQGNRFLVDGRIGRQLMNQTFDDIFTLVQEYQPMTVGIEVSGQQGAFVDLIRQEMVARNTFFPIARGKDGNREGIPARTNKMERLRLSIPFWKTGKMYLPSDLKSTTLVQELLDELAMVTIDGIKSKHDDCLDMVSQLEQMRLVYPDSYQANLGKETKNDSVYVEESLEDEPQGKHSYVV